MRAPALGVGEDALVPRRLAAVGAVVPEVRPRPRPQPQLAAVPLPEGVELPLAGDQRAVVVAAADVHHLHNIASVEP